MRHWIPALLLLITACVALVAIARDADAASARALPTFEMRDLNEREWRLSDDRFKSKPLLVCAFGTWQDASRRQAAEIQKFHEANPDVEIIAFVVDSLAEARDFVAEQRLTFPCYKVETSTRIGTTFQRLFETRKGKNLTLNRLPFVILTDAERNVKYAEIGPTDAASISAAR